MRRRNPHLMRIAQGQLTLRQLASSLEHRQATSTYRVPAVYREAAEVSCGCAKEAEGGPVPEGEDTRGVLNPQAFFPDPLACWLVFLGSSASPVSPLASRKPNSDGANGSLSICEGRVKSEEKSGLWELRRKCQTKTQKWREGTGQQTWALPDKVSSPTPLRPHLSTPIDPLGSAHLGEPPSHSPPPRHWHKNLKIRMQQTG